MLRSEEIGIRADGSDVTAAIQEALNTLGDLGGGKFYLGVEAVQLSYNVSGNIIVPDGVSFIGLNKAELNVTSVLNRLFLASGSGNTFQGFTIEGGGNLFVSGIEFEDGASQGAVDQVCFLNGQNAFSTMDSVRINAASGIDITDATHDHQYRTVHIRAGSLDINIERPVVTNLPNQGLFVLYGSTENVTIQGANVGPHLTNVIGNHMISGTGEASSVPTVNLKVFGNTFAGNPGIAFQIANGASVANGALADVVAIRNTDCFEVYDNTITHGGELGITAVHGSKNGTIRNNLLTDIDGAGIVVGAPTNGMVSNILVKENEIVRAGIDHQGPNFLSKNSRAAVRVWNSDKVAVVDNTLTDYGTYGVYVKAPVVGGVSVEGFANAGNTFSSTSNDPDIFYGDASATSDVATTNYTSGPVSAVTGKA